MFYDTQDLTDGEIVLKLLRTCEAQPEKNWVPAYCFDICLPDGTVAGHCDLRVGHSESTRIAGNIGYTVEPEHRGHHYAAKACALLFKQARKHGMDYLLITCSPENTASARTCEIAGGQFVELAPLPESSEMYCENRHFSNVYRFDLHSLV